MRGGFEEASIWDFFPPTKDGSNLWTAWLAWWLAEKSPCLTPSHATGCICRWELADSETFRVWPCRAQNIPNTDFFQKNWTVNNGQKVFLYRWYIIPNSKIWNIQCVPIWDTEEKKRTIQSIRSWQTKPWTEPSSQPISLRIRNIFNIQGFKPQSVRSGCELRILLGQCVEERILATGNRISVKEECLFI